VLTAAVPCVRIKFGVLADHEGIGSPIGDAGESLGAAHLRDGLTGSWFDIGWRRDSVVDRSGAVQRAAIALNELAARPEIGFIGVPEAAPGRIAPKGGDIAGAAGVGAIAAVHP